MSEIKRKRILLSFYTPLFQAGVPNVMMNIVRQLNHEYDFDLLLTEVDKSQTSFYDEEFLSYGGKIYYCKGVNWFSKWIGELLNIFLTVNCVYKLCKTNKYDVIHCHDSNYSGAKLFGAMLAGTAKRIAHSHVLFTKFNSHNPIKAWIKNSLLTSMTNKFSTDRLACSNISGESIYKGKTFVNVLNPVDVEFFSSIKLKQHQGFNILQIGYYCHNKNQIFSVKLLKELRCSAVDAHLHFVGFQLDETYYKKIIDVIEEYELQDYVHFYPSDVDKKEVFSIMDVSVLPSIKEGFSITAVESQCANIPCVASHIVSEDVDIGLLYRENLACEVNWVKRLLDIKNTTSVLNLEKMNLMHPVGYAHNIKKIYN